MIHESNPSRTISRLWKSRVRIVAPIDDPAWQERPGNDRIQGSVSTDFVQRAFRLADGKQIVVQDGLTLYLPEYPQDWEEHPGAHISLEMIVFRAEDEWSPVRVSLLRPNSLFFFVPKERAIALLEGRQTELDLLRDLERNLTYASSTP